MCNVWFSGTASIIRETSGPGYDLPRPTGGTGRSGLLGLVDQVQ